MNTPKIAQNNSIWEYTTISEKCDVLLFNPNLNEKKYSIRINAKDKTNKPFKEANVSVDVKSSLMEAWKKGGSLGDNIEIDKNVANRVCLKDSGSIMKNIVLGPRQKGNIALNCNFYAKEAIVNDKRVDIDVTVIDDATGRVLGGETFVIMQDARPSINPNVKTNSNILEVANVYEDVLYEWYDKNGKLVGTGQTFKIPAGASTSDYTVKVQAKSDGAISYSTAQAPMLSSIKNVDAKSRKDAIVVTFENPTVNQSTLRVALSAGNSPVADYTVDGGAETYDIPASNMVSGVYQVTLIENGKVTGTKKFVK